MRELERAILNGRLRVDAAEYLAPSEPVLTGPPEDSPHDRDDARAGLAVTYRNLDRSAQLLLSRLSVLDVRDFSGLVVAPLLELDAATAAEALRRLVDARLVDLIDSATGDRYRLQETAKGYARERFVDERSGDGPADETADLSDAE
jgi:hypothetical protein